MRLAAGKPWVLCLLVLAAALQSPIHSVPPNLVDRCGDRADTRAAPIVVVGVIESDVTVRRPVPMHSDHATPVQLRRARVAIENVLRGEMQTRQVEIYYFTWAGGFNGPQPLGMWSAGSRRIFWLRSDVVLRTSCDGWDTCTWGVYSGSHPRLELTPGAPIDRAVADIVLTRGEGAVNETRFASAILRGAPVPQEYQMENYRRLAMTEQTAVKSAACEALWFSLHDPKLRAIAAADMKQAHCGCRQSKRGEPDCGAGRHTHDDPPY